MLLASLQETSKIQGESGFITAEAGRINAPIKRDSARFFHQWQIKGFAQGADKGFILADRFTRTV